MTSTKHLKATAYHEAGHAAVAWHQGIRVRHVSIVPDAEYLGRVVHGDPLRGIRLDFDNSDRTRLRAERLCRVLLAGFLVEKRHTGRGNRIGASADHEAAVKLMDRFVTDNDEAEAWLNLLAIQTRNIIALPHITAAIDALATALLEHRELSGRRVVEIATHPAKRV